MGHKTLSINFILLEWCMLNEMSLCKKWPFYKQYNFLHLFIPSISFNKRKQQRDFDSYRILLLCHDINIEKIYTKSESSVFWKERSTCTFVLLSFRGRNWTAPIFLSLFSFSMLVSHNSSFFPLKQFWHKYKSFYSPSSKCWVDLKLMNARNSLIIFPPL